MPRKNPPDFELDKFKNWLNNLRKASQKEIVLVDCKSDKDELESFAVENVILLDKESPYKTLDYIAGSGKKCILLTDLNPRGRKLTQQLEAKFEDKGIKFNPRFRKLLFTTKIRTISALGRYLHREIPTRRKDIF